MYRRGEAQSMLGKASALTRHGRAWRRSQNLIATRSRVQETNDDPGRVAATKWGARSRLIVLGDRRRTRNMFVEAAPLLEAALPSIAKSDVPLD